MVDTIGSTDLHMVEGPAVTNKRNSTVTGHYDSAAERLELEELFRDSETGIAIHTFGGGRPLVEDQTEIERYIQFCLFGSSDRMLDGWYALRGFDKGIDNEVAELYPWTIGLFFIGTLAEYLPGYDVTSIGKITNDWGI